MKNENKKKGFLGRLSLSKKTKKNSSCCNFEIEMIPEENNDNKGENQSPKNKGNFCCRDKD